MHRAWLVNDDDVPIGVASFTDILCLFTEKAAPLVEGLPGK